MSAELVLAALGLVFAGVDKGAVGFGLPMVAAPLLTGFIGPRPAVIVMSIVNFVAAAIVAGRVRGVPLRSYAGLLTPISLAGVAGILVGANLLAVLSPVLLSALVGLTAIVFALLATARIELKLRPGQQGPIGALIGLGAGLLAGTTSVWATPVVMYFQAVRLPKRDFVVLLNVVVCLGSLVQIVSYVALGLYTADVLTAVALTIACVATGIGLGFIIQDRVDQRLFNRAVILVIFLVGLRLVVAAFLG